LITKINAFGSKFVPNTSTYVAHFYLHFGTEGVYIREFRAL